MYHRHVWRCFFTCENVALIPCYFSLLGLIIGCATRQTYTHMSISAPLTPSHPLPFPLLPPQVPPSVSSGSEAEAEAWGAKLLQAAFPSAVDVSGNGILQAQQHTTPDGQVRSRKNMYTCVYSCCSKVGLYPTHKGAYRDHVWPELMPLPHTSLSCPGGHCPVAAASGVG